MSRLDARWLNFWRRGQTWYHFDEDTPAAGGAASGAISAGQAGQGASLTAIAGSAHMRDGGGAPTFFDVPIRIIRPARVRIAASQRVQLATATAAARDSEIVELWLLGALDDDWLVAA